MFSNCDGLAALHQLGLHYTSSHSSNTSGRRANFDARKLLLYFSIFKIIKYEYELIQKNVSRLSVLIGNYKRWFTVTESLKIQ